MAIFQQGAVAEAQDCARPRAENGQWLCVTDVNSDGKKCTIELYSSEGEARAAAVFYAAAGPAAATAPTPVHHHEGVTMGWAAKMVQDINSITDAASSEYNGREVRGIELPIFNGAVFSGMQVVDATIKHVGTTFEFIFQHDGKDHTVSTSEAKVRRRGP